MRKLFVLSLIAIVVNLALENESLACWGRLRIHFCRTCQSDPCYRETCDAGPDASMKPCRIDCPAACYAAVINGMCICGCVDGNVPSLATSGAEQTITGLNVKRCPLKYLNALLGFQKWNVDQYTPQQLGIEQNINIRKMKVKDIAKLVKKSIP